MQQQALLQQNLLLKQQQLMAIQQQPHLSELEKAQLINKIMQVCKTTGKSLLESWDTTFLPD